jgi:hypothetical protein
LEGRWWYSVLERSGLDNQFYFSYAALETNGIPVGIAPLFLMNVPIDLVAPSFLARIICGADRWFPQLRYQRTLFIGSPCADEGAVGLVLGVGLHDVALILQDAVYSRAQHFAVSMIVLERFP